MSDFARGTWDYIYVGFCLYMAIIFLRKKPHVNASVLPETFLAQYVSPVLIAIIGNVVAFRRGEGVVWLPVAFVGLLLILYAYETWIQPLFMVGRVSISTMQHALDKLYPDVIWHRDYEDPLPAGVVSAIRMKYKSWY